jgi:hypothetical protein
VRAWWVRDPKWRNILVLQFNFNVLMHFFRVCYSSLKPEHTWHKMFDARDFEKFSDIETLFGAYIADIENREDYKQEIGNSRQWLLDYALEYAHLIWADQHSVAKRKKGGEEEGLVTRELRMSSLLQELGSIGDACEEVFHMELGMGNEPTCRTCCMHCEH